MHGAQPGLRGVKQPYTKKELLKVFTYRKYGRGAPLLKKAAKKKKREQKGQVRKRIREQGIL